MLIYSQKWLNLVVDDRHKIEKKKQKTKKTLLGSTF
jgi:hypothetical protein